MAAAIQPGWSKPGTVLFASEIPVNERAFSFALAEAAQFGAKLILFHADENVGIAASQKFWFRRDGLARPLAEEGCFEPLALRAANLGVQCSVVIRPGPAAEQILAFLHERKIDRVVMGAHSPGPVGKLLVGSVAEAVLRNSSVPVSIVGPYVVEGAYRNLADRTILCSACPQKSGCAVTRFAAELAARHNARLILQHVIPPQERAEALAGRTLPQMEAELHSLVPDRLQGKLDVRTRAVLGDPTEELLYQGRVQHANLIVLGAQGASQFAAVSRAGIVYKVLAYAHCPVITLSPVLLAECGAAEERPRTSELCLAGVF
ncbi:MAG: universal stress protein [Terracidiphilus sp.]|jgi:nucleotide-binding universal stress UspA family protein